MQPSSLYAAWVVSDELTAAELSRALNAALAVSDGRTVQGVLRQRACTKKLAQRARDSKDPGALAAWLFRQDVTEADLAWFASELDLDLVLRTMNREEFGSPDSDLLQLLWKRGGETLRLEVLKRVRWHHRTPRSWGTWLLRARPFKESGVDEMLVFADLGATSPDFAWEVATSSGAVEVMSWVLQGMGDRDVRDHHRSRMLETLSAHLEAGEFTSVRTAATVDALTALKHHLEKRKVAVAGTPELALALRALEVLPLEEHQRYELQVLAGSTRDEHEERPSTREDLLEALAGGRLPRAALEAALSSRSARDEELWEQVASSPALDPDDAVKLLEKMAYDEREVGVQLVLSERSEEWQHQLGRACWHAWRLEDGPRAHVLRRLAPEVTERLYRELVQEDPVRNLAKLVSLRVHTPEALGLLPLKVAGSVEREVHRALLELARARLGTDEARWEVFDALLEGCEGTYGELLAAADSLAANPTQRRAAR